MNQSDNSPVINVSWNDAQAFCRWLSRKEERTYRLPTEAQWEYACRAGTTTRYYNGNDSQEITRVGNVTDAITAEKFHWGKEVRTSDGYAFSAPVGQFKPNAFGLFDMHGNAAEWCQDWYAVDYYSKRIVDDPQGPDSGTRRVFRGGGWNDYALDCRSASRSHHDPSTRYNSIGFRVLLVPSSSGR